MDSDEQTKPLNWAETKSIVFELESLFSRKDDRDDIRDIIRLRNELEDSYRKKLADAKAILKEMSEKVAKKEKDLRAPEEAAHAERVAALMEDQKQLRASLQERKARLESLQERVVQLERERDQLAQRRQDKTTHHLEELPRLKHEISLYAHVTHLKWNYNSDILSGVIAVPETEELRSFEIDPNQLSKYEVANKIWDVIDPQTDGQYEAEQAVS